MGTLRCKVGQGPDPRGKDADCPDGRDPTVEVAIATRVSKVTEPWGEEAVSRVSEARVVVTKMDSVTGSGVGKVCQCPTEYRGTQCTRGWDTGVQRGIEGGKVNSKGPK